jgi:5-methylcytosine-specific restriction protein A
LPLLYFWRWDNYQRDLRYGVGYHLNQRSKGLHAIEPGDSLWAFSRRPSDGAYVLVAELVARAKTINHPRFRYGRYRLWGDLTHSRYFSTDGQGPIDAVIRSLSLSVMSHPIGRAFQGPAAVRSITAADEALLRDVASMLGPEPRARLIPEDRFEALALAGDREEVQRLLAADGAGLAQERRDYLYGDVITRSRSWARTLRELYDDRCQLCGWSARGPYRTEVCEAHHLHWLSRGGDDALENLVLLCPNHHRVVHRNDAVLDFGDLSFVFHDDHREMLRFGGHLAG